MTRRQLLLLVMTSTTALTVGYLHYNDVVDNPRASGIAIAAFLVEWLGGIFGICTAGSYILTSLALRGRRKR